MNKISIQRQNFTIDNEINLLCKKQKDIGAIASFIGKVRDINSDDKINSMTLEHYPGMTEKSLNKIACEANDRWNLNAVTIIHRVGELCPGDNIVLVLSASKHRGDAFAACEFIMDFLKTRAPFWKKEKTDQGEKWVASRQSDFDKADKWDKL